MNVAEYLSHRVATHAEPPDELDLPTGAIDASFGEPDPALFPVDLIRDAASAVLAGPSVALQYSSLRGHPDLIEAIVAREEFAVDPSQVVLTSGSIPALLLLTHTMVDAGDLVLFEEPGYFRARAILQAHGARLLPLKRQSNGFDLEALHHSVRRVAAPKAFAFVHPSFQNPSGYTWSLDERRQFLSFCADHRIVVVEDTAYDSLWSQEPPPPNLYALASDCPVIRIGTLSKTLAPGVGVGWVVTSATLASVLVDNRVEFGGVGALSSAIAASVLRDPRFATHETAIRREYAERCFRFCAGVRSITQLTGWSPPGGGFYAWLPLPEGVTDDAFVRKALTLGLRVLAGRHFFQSTDRKQDFVRVTFSRLPPETIDTAVARLAETYGQTGGAQERLRG